jgi:xanthine dehydrogenase YagR molybdenum-binding subunit
MSERKATPPFESPLGDVEIKVGFAGHYEKRTVSVPDGDAPPWDADTKFAVVGTDVDRVDGLLKASGRAKYSYDVTFPGMLYGMILRANIARGKLTGLELDDAKTMPGVAAVIAIKQVGHKVRFVGDEIAAVAATTLDQCRDAIEKIRASYEGEGHNVDFLTAEGAPQLDAAGDPAAPWEPDTDTDSKRAEDKKRAFAEVETALAASATQHTGTYRTEVQTHSSLETHGAVAKWTGDDLDIWSSTQATFGVRGEMAQAMRAAGVKCDSITVHSEFVGGGFGSKFNGGPETRAAALLAKEAKAPVKLMLDRFEEHTCTGNRPSMLMQIRAGVDMNGAITAWDLRSFGGCGHNGQGGGVAIPNHFLGKSKRVNRHKDIANDTDPVRPMRAPSHPQGFFGAELFLDELAAKAGIDPLALRIKNDSQAIRQAQYTLGAETFGWQKARNPKPGSPMPGDDPRWLRGCGMATARWGGLGGQGQPPFGILCRIHQDGTVESRSGAQDIGTGNKTLLAMITAEELGIPVASVKATMGHTSDPSGPGSGGSTTAPSLAPAVRHAAFLAKQELAKLVGKHLGVAPETVKYENGKVGPGAPMMSFTDACKLIGPNPIEARGQRFANYKGEPFERGVCGAQFAEVLVDTWTGVVRVVRMLALQDCGVVIAKKLAESQVLGAMIQGISYALHEQRIMDRASGRMLNGDFLRYKITGPKDMPPMQAILQTVVNGHTNTSVVGLGEPPSVAAPAAVANAVFNATSVPVRHLPITPDKVLAALSKRKGN